MIGEQEQASTEQNGEANANLHNHQRSKNAGLSGPPITSGLQRVEGRNAGCTQSRWKSKQNCRQDSNQRQETQHRGSPDGDPGTLENSKALTGAQWPAL